MNILVIAPHPDDEVLGCGGTIKKYSKRGDSIYVCYVTKGYAPDWSEEYLLNRPKEVDAVQGILGIKHYFWLDFPSAKVDTVPLKNIVIELLKIIKEVKPDIVFAPHVGDIHQDHRSIHKATLIAARPLSGNSIIKKLLIYEVLSGTEWGNSIEPFLPAVYEDVSSELSIKLEALKTYKSELKEFPHPRSLEAVEALAIKRGSEAGLYRAESFMLIREINKETSNK